MKASLLLIVLAGCFERPTYVVDVRWHTSSRLANVPDEQIGARIEYEHEDGSISGEWKPGYDSDVLLIVGSFADTSPICVELQRKTQDYDEQWGHDVLVDVYTPISTRVCSDVQVEGHPVVVFEISDVALPH
jgi:hypothetical protein